MSKRQKSTPSARSAPSDRPAPPAAAVRRPGPFAWLAAAAVVVAVVIAYRPAAEAGFIWDDNDYVTENEALRTPGGLFDIWFKPSASPQYYPLVFTTFWVEHRLWGDAPRGYHETNVLLHAASAVLLWRVLLRLRVPGALVAAGVFALHPVMVESVAWVTERKNTLSMFFYLASLYAYVRFARLDEDDAPPAPAGDAAPPRWPLYGAALVLFLCALWSKTVTASLPAAILLIVYWRRGRVTRRDVALVAPLFVLGLAAGLWTAYVERTHVGAAGAEWNYTLPQRLLIAGRALWFYAGKLLWPANLAFMYEKWPVDPRNVMSWLWPAAAVALPLALFALRHRIGRGPLVAVLIFGGTLVPALGFVNVYPMRYTFAADHYQYHAAAAFITLVVALIATAAGRSSLPRRQALVAPVAAGLLLVVLAALTFRQSRIYHDQPTLWADTVAKSPNSWMAWVNLGNAATAKQPPDWSTARAAYFKALKLAPEVPDVHFNVGNLHLRSNDFAAAAAAFERAARLEPTRYVNAWNMFGYCLVAQGQIDRGIAQYREALKIKADHWATLFNLGVALRQQGKLDEAAEAFIACLDAYEDYPLALRELAGVRVKANRFAEAVPPLQRLLALRPDDPEVLFDLGAALVNAGQPDAGRAHMIRAVTLKPELGDRLRGNR
jgi:Flp pilus assembly protein TadD